jgi:hypothetical protein
MEQISWQKHLGVVNTTNEANGNFAAFIDMLNVSNLKNDRINSLTKDTNGIFMVFDDSFKVKIIHSCKNLVALAQTLSSKRGASPVLAHGHSPSSLTQSA